MIRRFDLSRLVAPFRRCLRCNAPLADVEAREVAGEVPPRVRETARAYRRCPTCHRAYWAGTHQRGMERILEEAIASPGGAPLPDGQLHGSSARRLQ